MSDALDWYQSLDMENDPELITTDVQLDVAVDIERLMEAEGLSKKELATRIGSSASYITQVLSGEKNLTIKSMVKLANAMGKRPRIEFIDKIARRSWREALINTGTGRGSMTPQWPGQKHDRTPVIKDIKTATGPAHV